MDQVYVKADAQGRVVEIGSSAFLGDAPVGWVQVDAGEGDRYRHAQGNYLPLPLITDEGVPRYKLQGGAVTERTQAELAADAAALPAETALMLDELVQALAEHDYRLCLLELGVTESDL